MQPPLPLSLDYIRQVLAEYFADKPVRKVELFGSYARGEATVDSDVDLLLSRVPGATLTLFDLSHYQDDLQQRLGVVVDLGTALSPFTEHYIRPDLHTMYEQAA